MRKTSLFAARDSPEAPQPGTTGIATVAIGDGQFPVPSPPSTTTQPAIGPERQRKSPSRTSERGRAVLQGPWHEGLWR